MKIHDDNARVMYAVLREKYKCPSIIAFKLFDFYYVESKDGLIRIEQLKANNCWEAKIEGVQEWVRENGKREVN